MTNVFSLGISPRFNAAVELQTLQCLDLVFLACLFSALHRPQNLLKFDVITSLTHENLHG